MEDELDLPFTFDLIGLHAETVIHELAAIRYCVCRQKNEWGDMPSRPSEIPQSSHRWPDTEDHEDRQFVN